MYAASFEIAKTYACASSDIFFNIPLMKYIILKNVKYIQYNIVNDLLGGSF